MSCKVQYVVPGICHSVVSHESQAEAHRHRLTEHRAEGQMKEMLMKHWNGAPSQHYLVLFPETWKRSCKSPKEKYNEKCFSHNFNTFIYVLVEGGTETDNQNAQQMI